MMTDLMVEPPMSNPAKCFGFDMLQRVAAHGFRQVTRGDGWGFLVAEIFPDDTTATLSSRMFAYATGSGRCSSGVEQLIRNEKRAKMIFKISL